MSIVRITALAGGLLALAPSLDAVGRNTASQAMTRAAGAFLASLAPEQRARAQFDFGDAERVNWHFVPRVRRGLPLKEMNAAQQALARELVAAGLSQRGLLKANTIMELDLVLREAGGNPGVRDPELYYFSIFGAPSEKGPWGWRVEGHHLSLNFTIVDGAPVAFAPSFFGANPAHVRSGPREGLRALAAEEDLARQLVASLDAEQRAEAILEGAAPRDIITGNAARVDPLAPNGISIPRLRPQQVTLLVALIDEYLSRMDEEIATERRARLARADFSRVTFAWAGSIEPGEPHYYRVQGPSFLIEYDNTQSNANHVHTVWRDFEGDFGRDVLREHYREGTHQH